jgi:hypothetical protein
MVVITTQSLSAADTTILLALGAAGVVVSYIAIGRRDI